MIRAWLSRPLSRDVWGLSFLYSVICAVGGLAIFLAANQLQWTHAARDILLMAQLVVIGALSALETNWVLDIEDEIG